MIADSTLINDFIDESNEFLLIVEENLLILESNRDKPEDDVIDKVFRGIHSIKGSAGFLNFKKIAELAHVMETLLDKMRANEIEPESRFIDVLLKSTDLLKQMINDLDNSEEFFTQEMIAKINDLSQNKKPHIKESQNSEKISEPEQNLLPKKNDFTEDSNHCFSMHFDLHELYNQEKITPVDLIRDLNSMGKVINAKLSTNAVKLDQDLTKKDLMLDIVYETPLDKEVIMTMFVLSAENINSHQKDLPAKKIQNTTKEKSLIPNFSKKINAVAVKLESEGKIKKTAPPPKKITKELKKTKPKKVEGNAAKESSASIRISVNILDKLMSLASELVLVRNRLLMESSNSNPIISDISQDLDVVTSEMQETVMLTRMQPLGNVFNKMPRIVRDLTRRFHKNIDIQINGNDVELDKNILEVLSSPLVHIIRNACDHGIEMPEVRYGLGKPETGLITVNAYHQAGLIHIEISDDGKGLDPNMIRAKAIEKGIISKADLDQLNDKDVFSLIMTPGFSTVSQMNDISGRGVGMDVVKTAIAHIGGVIEIDSKTNSGTRIHMSLPLTLAIIPCLIVITNNERYAIPQVNMDEMVRLYDSSDQFIERSGDQEVYRLRDRLLPIVRLNELLKRSIRYTHKDRAEITDNYTHERKVSKSVLFAVVKTGSKRFGLVIDQMTGTEEIVVNPLPNTLKYIQIYQGTTIMGDGEVAMVLDIDGIARHVGVEFNRTVEDENLPVNKKNQSINIQRILTFEYGPKEQFAIPLIMVRRLTQIKHNQIEKVGANDDREFVTIDGEPVFIVRLDRLIEVSKCIEQKQYYLCLFKDSNTPFGILFTKLNGVAEMPEDVQKENYNLNCIFGCALVNDRLTLLLDLYELMDNGENKWFSKRSLPEKTKQLSQVLLVEDTVFFSQLVRNFLESNGYIVHTAENGLEGLSVLEKIQVDLIVSDIEMPIMDGWKFIQAVRNNKRYQHIPAMALSALNSPESIERSLKMGFNAHEVKIDKDRMLACVENLLNKT